MLMKASAGMVVCIGFETQLGWRVHMPCNWLLLHLLYLLICGIRSPGFLLGQEQLNDLHLAVLLAYFRLMMAALKRLSSGSLCDTICLQRSRCKVQLA